MRRTKWYAFRLSSKRRSTCEDLRRAKARIEAAAATPATVETIDSAALENLESMAPNILAWNRRLGDVESQWGCCGVSRELELGLADVFDKSNPSQPLKNLEE
jgi:hypothetical protein